MNPAFSLAISVSMCVFVCARVRRARDQSLSPRGCARALCERVCECLCVCVCVRLCVSVYVCVCARVLDRCSVQCARISFCLTLIKLKASESRDHICLSLCLSRCVNDISTQYAPTPDPMQDAGREALPSSSQIHRRTADEPDGVVGPIVLATALTPLLFLDTTVEASVDCGRKRGWEIV